jgi:hypothetical protein
MFQPIGTFVPKAIHLLAAQVCTSMQFTSKFTYIKKKDLDDIEKAHGTTNI